MPVFEVMAAIKAYDWGSTSSDNICRPFNALGDVDPDMPIAEAWFGTHPAGETIVCATGQTLSKHNSGPLPFLFKFLSVAKCLSIQMHPDAEWARKLHETTPELYPDSIAKAEMTIAMTPFEAFAGFKDLTGLAESVALHPELSTIYKEWLSWASAPLSKAEITRILTKAILGMDDESFKRIIARATAMPETMVDRQNAELISELMYQYPGDRGILIAVLLMQHHKLSPGECLYIPPNVPHAYLHGDAIEIMAASDNVVRIGLTPKPKDTETFFAIADFGSDPPTPTESSSVYHCPWAQECSVNLLTADQNYSFSQKNASGFLIVTSGTAHVGTEDAKETVSQSRAYFFNSTSDMTIVPTSRAFTAVLVIQSMQYR